MMSEPQKSEPINLTAAESTALAADWFRLGAIWLVLVVIGLWCWKIEAGHPPLWLLRNIDTLESRIKTIESRELGDLRARILRLEDEKK